MGKLETLSEREWQFVHTTYANALDEIGSNEELGERRLQILLTLLSAAGLSIGLVADSASNARSVVWAASGAAFVVTIFGALTVLRLVHRNVVTTDLIKRLEAIRKEVTIKDSLLQRLWIRDPFDEDRKPRRLRLLPVRGGLAEFAAASTALTMGAAVLFAVLALQGSDLVVVLMTGSASLVTWLLQVWAINRYYEKKKV